MSISEFTAEQIQEVTDLEEEYGFPGLIIAASDTEISETLTPFQRQHASNWLFIARHRFGEELCRQLGRQPTLRELAARLELSISLYQRRRG